MNCDWPFKTARTAFLQRWRTSPPANRVPWSAVPMPDLDRWTTIPRRLSARLQPMHSTRCTLLPARIRACLGRHTPITSRCRTRSATSSCAMRSTVTRATPTFLGALHPGRQDAKVDPDDFPCANPSFFGFPAPPFINIIGCIGSDLDFDGTPYGLNWPGTGKPSLDAALHPTAIQFSSPVFKNPWGAPENFGRVAFETDFPAFGRRCRLGTTAPGCPDFYPFFTTVDDPYHRCWWRLGGADIPDTINNFGGSAATEYGKPLELTYPTPSGSVVFSGEDLRQVEDSNKCQVDPLFFDFFFN